MNYTEQLYEITKLTKQALETVEKGHRPMLEYYKIKGIIESDDRFRAREDLIEKIRKYFCVFIMICSFATSGCYAFRSLSAFVMTEAFWPGFGYVLITCLFGTIGYICCDILGWDL